MATLQSSNSQMFMSEFVMDGRFDALKQHRRVIQSEWWSQIDSIEHEFSGEFKRTFRMSRNCFNHLVNWVESKWVEVKGKHSYICAMQYNGGVRKSLLLFIFCRWNREFCITLVTLHSAILFFYI